MKRFYFVFTILLSLGLLAACGQGGSGEQPSDAEADEQSEETAGETAGEDTNEDATSSDNNSSEDSADADNEGESTEGNDASVSSNNEDTTDSSEEAVTETVNLYFPDEQGLETYKEERDVEASTESELPKATLQAWLDGPENEELVSFIDGNVEVQSVEEEDGTAVVSFSPELLDISVGSAGEAFITEQVALMMKQFGYDQTKILVDGEEQESLFGHQDATEPFSAGNPEDYETKE